MKNKRPPKSPTEDLRARAERFLTEADPDQEKVFIEFTEDVGRLVHELQVHQIELEMQNGELRRANQELEELHSKYADLYDFAPVGYFTLDQGGQILEVNLTGARLLGLERQRLLATPLFLLVEPESRAVLNSHLEQTFATSIRQTCELQLVTRGGPPFFVSMESIVTQDRQYQAKQCRSAISDITDRKQAQEALSLKQTVASLRKALGKTVQALSSTTAMRDAYTTRHQARVAQLAAAIAQEMGFSADRIEGMRVMGLLHDIGNMLVPLEILSKSGGTSVPELGIIREHVLAGYETVKAIDFPWPVAQAILQHHERLDGSGYPSGLSGQDIIVEARILIVADTVDTIARDLPHRPGLGIDQALEEIKQNRGTLYDPKIVDVCVRLFQEKGFRFDPQK
jgi:PAS domain S-box-containing protein/putative nucleotidyltransferase with HDIG domain